MLRNMARVAVVVPCYRVERHIARVIRTLPNWVWKIVVVVDASPDRTAEVVRQLNDRRIVLLEHERNQGVGGAMLTGYRECLLLGADIVVKMDGDGQMDPGDLPALLRPLLTGRADYAKGNRWHDPVSLATMPRVRRWGNLGLAFLSKVATGQWRTFDPCNGYTAIRGLALEQMQLDLVARDYFFEISMLRELNGIRAVVHDVPMPARYGDETSSLKAGRILLAFPLKLLRSLCRRIWRRYFVHDFEPTSLFLTFGLLLCGCGGTYGSYRWIKSWLSGTPTSAGAVMLAAMPFLMGFQMLLQAIVADVQDCPSEPLCNDVELRLFPYEGRHALPLPSSDNTRSEASELVA